MPGTLSPFRTKSPEPRRFAMVLRVRPERFAEYKRLHEAVWPGVLARISASSISNYSVFHRDGLLFSYFEYRGSDFETDMKVIGADLEVRRWWSLMEPMQVPLPSRAPEEWWARMQEIFHLP